jgi:two-component system response regulator HydG
MQADRIVGTHPIVRAIADAAERLARSGHAVFVIGERGTGKELFARQLHAAGQRPDEHFVRVDCAEPSEQRLEHELFERERGWERASGGTLLLDDLPSLSLELQRRLLESLRQASANARRAAQLVASMDQEIALQRRSGRLDGELIDHLCPVEVTLPALRQRRSDIPVLVEHFLALYAARNGVPDCVIETEALVHLWQYDWPGNVRELESVIERVVVLCPRGVVRSTDLPAGIRTGAGERGPSCRTAAPPTGGVGPQLRSTF